MVSQSITLTLLPSLVSQSITLTLLPSAPNLNFELCVRLEKDVRLPTMTGDFKATLLGQVYRAQLGNPVSFVKNKHQQRLSRFRFSLSEIFDLCQLLPSTILLGVNSSRTHLRTYEYHVSSHDT